MLKMTRRKLIAALLCTPFIAGAAWAQGKGLITIIVNDPANPYWFTEGEVAVGAVEEFLDLVHGMDACGP